MDVVINGVKYLPQEPDNAFVWTEIEKLITHLAKTFNWNKEQAIGFSEIWRDKQSKQSAPVDTGKASVGFFFFDESGKKIDEVTIGKKQMVSFEILCFSQQEKLDMAAEYIGKYRHDHTMTNHRIAHSLLYPTSTMNAYQKSAPEPSAIPTKEWQIESYQSSFLFTLKNGKYVHADFELKDPDSVGATIHSVRRLFDNTIWTSGATNGNRTIEKFHIGWAGMEVHYTDGSGELLITQKYAPIPTEPVVEDTGKEFIAPASLSEHPQCKQSAPPIEGKDYEILSFRSVKYENIIADVSGHPKLLEVYLDTPEHYTINSVKSGGEVFSVRETVLWDDKPVLINGFEISHGNHSVREAMMFYTIRGNNCNILYAKKLPPIEQEVKNPVLFTTEDGQNVYENIDLLWRVFTKPSSYECWKPYEMERPNYKVDGEKYFAAKEAAEQYIQWNKPQHSLASIMAKSIYTGKEGSYRFNIEDFTQKLNK